MKRRMRKRKRKMMSHQMTRENEREIRKPSDDHNSCQLFHSLNGFWPGAVDKQGRTDGISRS